MNIFFLSLKPRECTQFPRARLLAAIKAGAYWGSL